MVNLNGIFRAALVLVLCSLTTATVKFALSPVYGSTLTSSTHHITGIVAVLSTLLTNRVFNARSAASWNKILPCLSFAVPLVLEWAFTLSSQLGPTCGPLLTEMAGTLPLIFCSAHAFLRLLQPDYEYGRITSAAVLCGLFYGFFVFVDRFAVELVQLLCSSNDFTTRSTLQVALWPIYAASFQSGLVLKTMPLVLYSLATNTYLPSQFAIERLNSKLKSQKFVLLDRRESVTGYVSVLEKLEEHYRVLRCDHSLLGGEWLMAKEVDQQIFATNEPIYAIFTMLEAVRLMEWAGVKIDTPKPNKSALVIGMGVGTCVKALVAHGVSTTVIEIDPAVTYFARKYFDFPDNASIIHADAVTYIRSTQRDNGFFDYIIHDVFSGGVEPLQLFTNDFLSGLSDALNPHGSIAINFAGDLNHELTAIIWDTITSVFHQCRAFREFHSADSATMRVNDIDMSNLAIFCTKKDAEWHFRRPVEADFLDSQARRRFLLPKHEVQRSQLKYPVGSTMMLNTSTIGKLKHWQTASARAHWELLRKAIPSIVWENY